MEAKKTKKVLQKSVKKAPRKEEDLETMAMQEINKMKLKMAGASKKVEAYVKKNPQKAMLISAGVVAALAGAAALLTAKKDKKKKK